MAWVYLRSTSSSSSHPHCPLSCVCLSTVIWQSWQLCPQMIILATRKRATSVSSSFCLSSAHSTIDSCALDWVGTSLKYVSDQADNDIVAYKSIELPSPRTPPLTIIFKAILLLSFSFIISLLHTFACSLLGLRWSWSLDDHNPTSLVVEHLCSGHTYHYPVLQHKSVCSCRLSLSRQYPLLFRSLSANLLATLDLVLFSSS